MARRRLSEELSEWIASLRFSGYTVLIVALVVIGGLVVSPTLSTYVNQQRELAELRESVRLQQQAVTEADEARERWLDPSYVRSQARARLFYVMPGEMQLSVIEDVVIPADSDERTSDQLTAVESNWAKSLATSVLLAGQTAAVTEPTAAADTTDTTATAETAANDAAVTE